MRHLMIAASLMSFAAAAQAADFNCPPTIDVAQQKPAKDIPGWRAFVYENPSPQAEGASPHAMKKAEFSKGPPEDMEYMPGELGDFVEDWTLGADKYFLTCAYMQTDVRLTRELPTATKHCRIEYSKTAKNPDGSSIPEKITCE